MAVFLILALSAGLLLGSRFKVLILTPATAGAIVAVVDVGVQHAQDPWSIGLAILGVTLALQIGYLIGGSIVSAHQVTRKSVHLGRAPRPTL